jgi:hypothetical protein
MILLFLVILFLFQMNSIQASALAESKMTTPEVKDIFSDIPFYFEENHGQTDPSVKFLTRGTNYGFYFTGGEAVIAIAKSDAPSVLRLKMIGGNQKARIVGMQKLPGTVNYFGGTDSKNWHTNIHTYAKIKYEQIYPGIDLIFYGENGTIEYDFVISSGADPGRIRVALEGPHGVQLASSGDLHMRMPDGDLIQKAPRIYQEKGGKKINVAGNYIVTSDQEIRFHASYDRKLPLIIDPKISYSTYLGGSAFDLGNAITVDALGAVYVTGFSASPDFPTKNPVVPTLFGAFITKLSPTGSTLIFSTHLGGGATIGTGIAVDPSRAVYVTGPTTTTPFFPLKNPIQTHGGAFLTKLSPSGTSLVYSTYLGGSQVDQPNGIRLDSHRNAYIFGQTFSKNFPLKNPIQRRFGGGETDGFWLIVNSAGTKVLFSTYVGGNGPDSVDSLSIRRSNGNVLIAGGSGSKNFPKSSLKKQDVIQDCEDFHEELRNESLFFFMLDKDWEDLAEVLFPTTDCKDLWKGAEDLNRPSWDVTNFGYQSSSNQTGISAAAGGLLDAHITERDPVTLAPKRQIAFGGSGNEFPEAIALDSQGRIYIAGITTSKDLPVVNAVQGVNKGGQDGFVAVFDPITLQVLFATYIGGSGTDFITALAVDRKGNIYVTGFTASNNLRTTPRAFQRHRKGPAFSDDAFVVKITPVVP